MSVHMSPHHRSASLHSRGNFECNNCSAIVQVHEACYVSYGCIMRYYARESNRQRRALLSGNALTMDEENLIQLIEDHDANGWGELPQALRRLNTRISELSPALLSKKTAVCEACYSLFIDEKELQQAEVEEREKADRITPASSRSGLLGLKVASRAADPATDFVFTSAQEAMRLRHKQLREKERARRSALHELKHTIDWRTLPSTGHVAREVVAVLRDGPEMGLIALDSSALRALKARAYGNAKARNASEEVDFSDVRLPDVQPPRKLPAEHETRLPTPRGMTTHRSAMQGAASSPMTTSLENTLTGDTALLDDEKELDRVVRETVGAPETASETAFDIPLSAYQMRELWVEMCNICEYSAMPESKDVDDVPPSHSFYHIYSNGRLRFDDPPYRNVVLMNWRNTPVASLATATPEQRAAPTTAARSTVLSELTEEERRELSIAVAFGKDPGEALEMTSKDIRFMEGGPLESDDSSPGEEEEEEYEEEEGDEEASEEEVLSV